MQPGYNDIISIVKEQGIIPLFYHDNVNECVFIIDALYNAGLRTVEFTNRGNKAVEIFKTLAVEKTKRWPGLLLSAGTIKTTEAAQQFIDAGADFIICPGMIPEVAKLVQAANLVWVPGCVSPSEIITAEQHGAKLIKLFPGSLLGPSYVAAIKEIFPELLFMPTGGVEVNEENLQQWFHSGVIAVGLGSKVISKELIKNKDYEAIEQLAKKAISIVQIFKAG